MAALLAAAVILHGLVSGSAALRLAAASRLDFFAVSAICAAHGPQPIGQGEQNPLSPVQKHDHCAVCSAVGATFLAGTSVELPAPVLVAFAAQAPGATGPPGTLRRYERYTWRGPPVAA